MANNIDTQSAIFGQTLAEGGQREESQDDFKFGDEALDYGRTTGLEASQSTLEFIEYAKEFFVTELGEVIKMAAIRSYDPDILDELCKESKPLWHPKLRKMRSGTKR